MMTFRQFAGANEQASLFLDLECDLAGSGGLASTPEPQASSRAPPVWDDQASFFSLKILH